MVASVVGNSVASKEIATAIDQSFEINVQVKQ